MLSSDYTSNFNINSRKFLASALAELGPACFTFVIYFIFLFCILSKIKSYCTCLKISMSKMEVEDVELCKVFCSLKSSCLTRVETCLQADLLDGHLCQLQILTAVRILNQKKKSKTTKLRTYANSQNPKCTNCLQAESLSAKKCLQADSIF